MAVGNVSRLRSDARGDSAITTSGAAPFAPRASEASAARPPAATACASPSRGIRADSTIRTCPADCSGRHSVASAIMQLGDAWARPLDNTWYVQSTDRAAVLENRLKTHLDSEDGLLIQQVEADAVLLNTALRWFKKRRQEPAAATNVVAFPVPALPEARAA